MRKRYTDLRLQYLPDVWHDMMTLDSSSTNGTARTYHSIHNGTMSCINYNETSVLSYRLALRALLLVFLLHFA